MTLEALSDVVPSEAIGEVGVDLQWDRHGTPPRKVVRPSSAEEVAAVLQWAAANRVGVLPIGSGARAGSVAEGRYVALSMERMSGIEIYEPADLTFTAGAGTPVAEIGGVLRARHQWMPFDPPFVNQRSLGGLVALGESGPLWAGYGAIRNHVLGMTIVTGDGRVLRLGGRVVKNVAGFDLLKPMVGSRGRLGLITSVCLRVSPVPEVERLLLVRGASVSDFVRLAQRVGTAPVLPVSSVLVDSMGDRPGACLVVRLHGAAPAVKSDRARLERHLGCELEAADGSVDMLGRLRDHGADAAIWVEVTVSPSRLQEAIASVERLGPSAIAVDPLEARIRAALDVVERGVLSDARVSIEHLGGALRVTQDATGRIADSDTKPRPEVVDLTARVVQAFDPAGVLWPARGAG